MLYFEPYKKHNVTDREKEVIRIKCRCLLLNDEYLKDASSYNEEQDIRVFKEGKRIKYPEGYFEKYGMYWPMTKEEIEQDLQDNNWNKLYNEFYGPFQDKITVIDDEWILHKFILSLGQDEKLADIKSKSRIGWHEFRHTFASRLVQNNVPLYKVSKWLGHSSLTVTQIYANFAPTYDKDIEKLSLEEDHQIDSRIDSTLLGQQAQKMVNAG